MKIKQEYSPITITLQTQHEADVFIGIIDKVDDWHANANPPHKLCKAEREMIIKLSDSFTDILGLRR